MKQLTVLALAVCLMLPAVAQNKLSKKQNACFGFLNGKSSKGSGEKIKFLSEIYLMPTSGFGDEFPTGHFIMGEGLGLGIEFPKRFALTMHLQHGLIRYNQLNQPVPVLVGEDVAATTANLQVRGHALEAGFRFRYFSRPLFNAGISLYPQVGLIFSAQNAQSTFTDSEGNTVLVSPESRGWNGAHLFAELGFGVEKRFKHWLGVFGELNGRAKLDNTEFREMYSRGISLHAGLRFRL